MTNSKFFQSQTIPPILLFLFAVLAMALKNSSLADAYMQLLLLDVEVRADTFTIQKPLLLWVNDGLMAIFFFLVGLELKNEMLTGQLRQPANAILPVIGAAGGVIVPAAIYLAFNYQNTLSAHGWAIPTATDIAFTMGILALLGSRVPPSLKLFLLTLAIVDDLVGIIVIAFFYTSKLSLLTLSVASLGFIGMVILNRYKVTRVAPFLLCGILVWICFLKSGVHATLAGVVNAFFIPISVTRRDGVSEKPLEHLLHNLHPYVYFGVLPVFAFFNAGVILEGVSLSTLMDPIPSGIFLGLFVGKQLGIFGFCWLAIQLKLARLPANSSWLQFYGVSVLCGVGFTMSLFIASLAFADGGAGVERSDRLAILLGSICSAVLASLVFFLASPGRESAENREA